MGRSPQFFGPYLLWPNGLMDEDETWHAGRPRPWPHCVTWGPSSPSAKRERRPQLLAHICCGQMAGWIKMPLGREIGLSPSDIVLDGDPAPPKRCTAPVFGQCALWPNGWIGEDAAWYGSRPQPSPPPHKGSIAPNFRPMYCGHTDVWIKMPRGMEVRLGPGHIVLDGDPTLPPQQGAEPPIFGPCLLWPNSWMDQDGTWYGGRPRPNDVVLDGDPAPPKRCTAPSFRPMCIVGKRLDG